MEENAPKKRSKFKTVMKTAIGFLLFIVIVPVIAFNVSPFAGSMLIRALFNHPPQEPPEHLSYSEYIDVSKDIAYGASKYELLDLYLPKDKGGPCPLIIWIHGGAFVGGDKKDATYLAHALAFNGYAVAVINYSRAPEAPYPTPVLQTGGAYTFLTQGDYSDKERIDTQKVFFAGDSAGAHIAAQFLILQTNLPYREAFLETNGSESLPEVIPEETLKGALLYCGPFSVQRFSGVSHPLLKFLVWQTGWAYFGDRNLSTSSVADEIDLIQHVTGDFPAVFITDGNSMSFLDHARDLSAKLSGQGVYVKELFFDDEGESVPHEYQFELQSEAGQVSLEQALEFLSHCLK